MARKKNFLNNGDLYDETVISQQNGKMTDKLARMLMVLCARYRKSSQGDFTRYSYFEEMQAAALLNLSTNSYLKFNTSKYRNAFAFYTQCTHNSYLQYLNSEKRQQKVRDKLLVVGGLDPSFGYVDLDN